MTVDGMWSRDCVNVESRGVKKWKLKKGRFCEMYAQKGKFVRRASREPKLLVNTGSPGYGHVGPYIQKKTHDLLLIDFSSSDD